jgi:hypothetical protein
LDGDDFVSDDFLSDVDPLFVSPFDSLVDSVLEDDSDDFESDVVDVLDEERLSVL